MVEHSFLNAHFLGTMIFIQCSSKWIVEKSAVIKTRLWLKQRKVYRFFKKKLRTIAPYELIPYTCNSEPKLFCT